MGDFHRDAVPDVFSLKRTNTGTGGFEVHVLNAIMERVAEAENRASGDQAGPGSSPPQTRKAIDRRTLTRPGAREQQCAGPCWGGVFVAHFHSGRGEQLGTLCSGQRRAEEVTLALRAKAGLEVAGLCLRFDALGNDAESEVLAHRDDGAYDRRFVLPVLLYFFEVDDSSARDNTYSWIARTWVWLSKSLKDGMPRDSRAPPSTMAANCWWTSALV
jgi:hypothetical protein